MYMRVQNPYGILVGANVRYNSKVLPIIVHYRCLEMALTDILFFFFLGGGYIKNAMIYLNKLYNR